MYSSILLDNSIIGLPGSNLKIWEKQVFSSSLSIPTQEKMYMNHNA